MVVSFLVVLFALLALVESVSYGFYEVVYSCLFGSYSDCGL